MNSIAQEDVQVVAVVMDKRAIVRPPADRGDLSHRLALAVRHCLARWPQLHLYLDKRYTSLKLRQALERALGAALPPVPAGVAHLARKLTRNLCLQAVDYVAWAIAGNTNGATCRLMTGPPTR